MYTVRCLNATKTKRKPNYFVSEGEVSDRSPTLHGKGGVSFLRDFFIFVCSFRDAYVFYMVIIWHVDLESWNNHPPGIRLFVAVLGLGEL